MARRSIPLRWRTRPRQGSAHSRRHGECRRRCRGTARSAWSPSSSRRQADRRHHQAQAPSVGCASIKAWGPPTGLRNGVIIEKIGPPALSLPGCAPRRCRAGRPACWQSRATSRQTGKHLVAAVRRVSSTMIIRWPGVLGQNSRDAADHVGCDPLWFRMITDARCCTALKLNPSHRLDKRASAYRPARRAAAHHSEAPADRHRAAAPHLGVGAASSETRSRAPGAPSPRRLLRRQERGAAGLGLGEPCVNAQRSAASTSSQGCGTAPCSLGSGGVAPASTACVPTGRQASARRAYAGQGCRAPGASPGQGR